MKLEKRVSEACRNLGVQAFEITFQDPAERSFRHPDYAPLIDATTQRQPSTSRSMPVIVAAFSAVVSPHGAGLWASLVGEQRPPGGSFE